MKEHKSNLEFYYLKSIIETISCHALESNKVKLDNLFDKKKREIFKRHLNESFSNQSKVLFSKQDNLQQYAEQHESLIDNVITQTNNYIEEKQGNMCQIELFRTACKAINE